MWKMWRNRATNKNEILAGLCLLFAIGGIMLAGFGTKTGDITDVTLGEGTGYLEADEEHGEYAAGEMPQPTQNEQGQTVQEESKEQATQEETTDTSMAGDMTGTVVVQAGDSLWKIAEKYLGDGSQYIAIYEQNRELIGDDPRFILAGIELNLSGLESAE